MPRVLVADDDPVAREFICEVVRGILGLEVRPAKSMAEALALTAQGGLCAAFLDQRFSDGGILDYCKESCRRNPASAKLPKWMISGERPSAWDGGLWLSYGVLGYSVKPCLVEEISRAAKICLSAKL